MNEMPLTFPVPPTSLSKELTALRANLKNKHAQAFRACYERFEDCREVCDLHSVSPLIEAATNFVLDFDITAKRAIGNHPSRYRLFQMRFLKDFDRAACCSKLNLTHWTFASEIAAIEQAVGESLTSAGLFPLAPYFNESCSVLDRLAA